MDDYGYGSVDEVVAQTSGAGKYLKLEYNRTYQLRIVSAPKYVLRHWFNNGSKPVACTGDTCEYCGKDVKSSEKLNRTAQWGWVVIDREDTKVKILQGPNSVARLIKDLTTLENKLTKKKLWGDPRTFDIQVTKVKKENGFTDYIVQPVPDTKQPLSKEELAAIAEANIDLDKAMKGGKNSEHMGNYSNADLETAPEEEGVNPSAIPTDLGAEAPAKEKDHTEDVNPDDIPF